MSYKIVIEEYKYTYRSYMACEDQGEDDCVGTGYHYFVFNGKRKLKRIFYSEKQAQDYVKILKRQVILSAKSKKR
jgi:hypothetical protein